MQFVQFAKLRALAAMCLAMGAATSHAEQQPAGTEYWFAWPRTADVTGSDPAYDLDSELLVLTESTTPVAFTVQAPGLNVSATTVAGTPGRVRIPRSLMMDTHGVVETKGIHLSAEACGHVAALFRVPGSNSSVGDDVMTLLPTSILGTIHYPDTYHGLAEFVVVATQDDTRVTYDNPFCPGAVDVVLNRGETIEHLCDDVVSTVTQRGIAGTRIESDKPVAVMAGSAASTIIHYLVPSFPTPAEIFWCCADILMEQMRPTSDWEREYRTVPFLAGVPSAPGDVIRVMAACDGTEVVVNDGTASRTRNLAAGEVWELVESDLATRTFRLTKTPLEINANKPVQVNQYSVGWQVTALGDPSQAVVPGLLRTAGLHAFFVPELSQGHAHVVVPIGVLGNVALDGTPIPAASFTSYPDGRHAWARVGPLNPGEHRITSPLVPVSVLAYGFSVDAAGTPVAGQHAYPAPSFGPGGSYPVLVQPDDLCATHCAGDCLDLDAGPGYDSYAWATGETTRVIVACPGADSTFTVTVRDANGCEGLGVIDIPVVASPLPSISGNLVACEGECVSLSVAAGFTSVAWNNGDTSDTTLICPVDPVTPVSVIATNAAGCEGREAVELQLLRAPQLGSLQALDVSPCDHGVLVSWPAATWLNTPADGVYHVYRSELNCADALARAPIASAVVATSWLDTTTMPGVFYSYVVLAEDATIGTRCGDGPDHGGLTARTCISGIEDVIDRVPPPIGEGSTLRGDGHDGNIIRFRWDGAPPLDAAAGDHFHLHRSASIFGPFVLLTPEGLTARGHADPNGADAKLLFYDLRLADGCENTTRDPFPPTACVANSCQEPELAQGHAFSWDTCSRGCSSRFASHACGAGLTDGRDRVHHFETTAAAPLRVTLDAEHASLDVYLYDEALATCVAWADAELSLPSLPAGRHALVVDGPAGSEGAYSLNWEARP